MLPVLPVLAWTAGSGVVVGGVVGAASSIKAHGLTGDVLGSTAKGALLGGGAGLTTGLGLLTAEASVSIVWKTVPLSIAGGVLASIATTLARRKAVTSDTVKAGALLGAAGGLAVTLPLAFGAGVGVRALANPKVDMAAGTLAGAFVSHVLTDDAIDAEEDAKARATSRQAPPAANQTAQTAGQVLQTAPVVKCEGLVGACPDLDR